MLYELPPNLPKVIYKGVKYLQPPTFKERAIQSIVDLREHKDVVTDCTVTNMEYMNYIKKTTDKAGHY